MFIGILHHLSYRKSAAFILWKTCPGRAAKKSVFVNRTERPSGQCLSLNSSSFTLSVKNTGRIRPICGKKKKKEKEGKKLLNENLENKKLSKIWSRGLNGMSTNFFLPFHCMPMSFKKC